jgi:putative modified peptide
MTDFTLAQEDASIGQSEAWTRPAEKKYASLSREHSLALLQKLATDDGFRSRFEQKPAAALAELGVPQALIDSLPATSTAPMKLASREAFTRALEHFKLSEAEVLLCQSAPQVAISLGPQKDPAGDTKIPFAAS